MKLSPLALTVALAPSLALAAEPGDFDQQLKMPALVVTSGRQAESRQQATALTTVFTRADIERLQPSSVTDLLRRVPGVQVVRNGGRGSTSGLYLRGTKTAQSLVLVDGQRIGSASDGGAQLEALSVEQIERVEVLRGARSAVYGADAIGGVVQIFTRRAEGQGLQPRLRLGYGSRQTWERSVGLSGGDRDTRFNLSASADETRGINRSFASDRPDGDHDAYRNNAFALNLSHRFGERLEGGFSVLDQRGESEYDFGWDGAYPYNDYQLSSYAGFLAAQLGERWNSRLELGHSENRSVERFDDSPARSPFNTYRDSASWLNSLRLDGGHSLTLGADWHEDRLHSDTVYQQTRRWNQALILQHHWRGERFASELGLRHDRNEQFGSHNTFNAALTYHLDAANDLLLSYAEGFRAPTFNELYWPVDPLWGGGGNPDLNPETSKTYELQWRSQLGAHSRLEAALYRTDIEDALAGWPARNVDQARINGFEASLQQDLFGWQAALGLSLIDPRDRDTGRTLERRARRTLSLDLDGSFGAFAVGASWQALSRAYDDAANRRENPGHGVLGLRARWQASEELQFGVKLDNLLDKRYAGTQYSSGWPATYRPYREEGRSALLSVTWTPAL